MVWNLPWPWRCPGYAERANSIWGNDDLLFPVTAIEQGEDRQFRANGIARKHWATADAARRIFEELFEAIGLHGFNPHSFRHALVVLGSR